MATISEQETGKPIPSADSVAIELRLAVQVADDDAIQSLLQNDPALATARLDGRANGAVAYSLLSRCDIPHLGDWGIRPTRWEDLYLVSALRRFLAEPASYFATCSPTGPAHDDRDVCHSVQRRRLQTAREPP